jgi:pyridoxal phosphate enzyme (YggS family)
VRAEIADACARAGRSPEEVSLVGVSKTHPPEAVAAAVRAGLRDVGENRVQEAASKIPAVRQLLDVAPTWHLVGHLQTNKARQAVESFSMIESVDSVRLVEALSARARRRLEVLIEVNLTGEASKTGAPPDEVEAIVRAIGGSRNLRLQGLMAIGPLKGGPEAARPVFRRLRSMRDDLRQRFSLELPELSMGMSEDYPVGVEEGASMLRLGRVLFAASLDRGEASLHRGASPLK